MDKVTYVRLLLNKASVDAIFHCISPTLFSLESLGETSGFADENEQFVYPAVLRLSSKELEGLSWCLLDDGFSLFLYILE